MFIFEKFETVTLEPLRSHFVKIAHKVAKPEYFPISKMNHTRRQIHFPTIYSLLGLRLAVQTLSVWGGGGGDRPDPPPPFIL